MYVCTATNEVGQAAAEAEVYVQVPPMISRLPAASVVVEGGAEARLDCEARWVDLSQMREECERERMLIFIYILLLHGRGRPKPLVVWMHEEERTFLLAGDTAGNLEVTSDAALLVTSPEG